MNDVPTIQGRLAALSPDRRALVIQRLRQRTEAPTAAPIGSAGGRIPRADRTRPIPLSFTQEDLWTACKLEGPTATYNVAAAVRLVGPLDRNALERALRAVTQRHEALRTRFIRTAAGIAQHITDADAITVESVPSHAEGEATALDLAAELVRRAFDLERAPPWRVSLIEAGADKHFLVLVLHHLIADGWSMRLLVADLAAAYRAAITGAPLPAFDLPVQYADYAAWERGTVDQAAMRAALERWRHTLQGCSSALDLAPDRPRTPSITHRGATLRFTIPAETIGCLRTLAAAEGAIPFMAALAALDVLLARYSGQDDIVVGCALANRRLPETLSVVGYFVNTLPVRVDLTGDPSFREVLRRARAAGLAAIADQAVPLGLLVSELAIDRDPSRTPIFQIVLAYQSGPANLELPGLHASRVDLDLGTAKFELTFIIEESAGGWCCSIEYNTDLFEESSIARMADHLRRLIEAGIAAPDRPAFTLDLLSPAERQTILGAWAGRRGDYPRNTSVADLFAAQAARAPAATALMFGDAKMSYGDLDRRANRVANRLNEIGVGRGALVGLAAPRSFDMVVGMLGILKAGAGYVPLDQGYPEERLRFMARDAGLRLILIGDDVCIMPVVDCATLSITEASAAGRHDALPGMAGAEDVAYVMYTSGSTGDPKGSRIPHRAIARLVRGTDFADFGPDETILQLAPISFDASTLEIWGALLNGGRLAIAPPELPTPAEIGALIRRYGVTTMWLTAGLFHLMVEERLADLQPLRQLLSGGDALSLPHALRAARAIAPGRVINGYGPTENTTFTCCHTIDPARDYGASVPIGRPIANTSVYILDRHLQPVPPGVMGELYVGGDGLALDYLNRPELNAERFIANPFSDGRLYCTGDLARWLPDGAIEFLGRADHQVKIRGFRVEPAEIEAVLRQNPELSEAAVVVAERAGSQHATPGAHKKLVAYLVPADPAAVADAALVGRVRDVLRRLLPDFMIPASFVTLSTLPLSANGKVNRGALPALNHGDAGASSPVSASEAALAAIFCEVLGLDDVGRAASFFSLGGNSLIAMQLVSRIEARLGLALPLGQVFQTPTIESLAEAIDGLPRMPGSSAPIPRFERTGPLPLSFAQERLWFLYRLEPENPFYNIAVALRIDGPLAVEALAGAIEAVIRRHEILRTTYDELDGRLVQRIHDVTPVALPVIGLFHIDEVDGEIERRAREETRRPFDLSAGPMIRATVLACGQSRHVLLLTLHHIAADGWSMGVLVRELTASYVAICGGKDAALPSLTVQYADFAVWQRREINGQVYAQQSGYWKEKLADYPAELTLPTDRLRPRAQSFRGGSVRFTIDAETSQALNQLARDCSATLFMVLLTALGILLSRHAGQTDLVIGTPIANRWRPELEPLIGFFVNTLALRLDLSGDPGLHQLLARVRQLTLDAYANQDLPFERLVDELQTERDLSRNPLFQVMFALQNAPIDDLNLPGLAVEVLDFERSSAQFDLVLDVWERPEGLLGVLEFSTDLFDRDRIERMLEQFRTLLAGIAADPQRPVSALPLLPEAERRLLLDGFNCNRANFPIDRTLHALFEEQAAATPDRVAAEYGDRRMTYRDLNAGANRLAHRLRRLGLDRNAFAVLLLDRSIDFLTAMLAVLKAGGAYVPIDPVYPADRIDYMLANSAARFLITNSQLRERASAAAGTELVCVKIDAEDLSAEAETDPRPVNAPTDRAYMLYTSGSTGQPKGAILRHDGKINHIYGQLRWLGLHHATVFLQSAPASSDISVWQFLGPVLIGGHTVIADWETVCDPRALWQLITGSGITIIELVPVVMSALLEYTGSLTAEERRASRLEWAMATGEAVPPALVNQWLEQFPYVPIVNAYGPTEAADDVCQFVLREPLPATARGVPIGTPLANLTLYVVDDRLDLVPIGVPGEICVSGIGVGEGYWRDEAGTRERFVANPYAAGGRGEVLYRTGDRGFWRGDGVLECLSRLDEQVKLRGFRIELGEIESALGRRPAVRDAVVVTHAESDSADTRLIAYLTPNRADPEVVAATQRAREEQVALWRDLHDREYRQILDYGDPTFNVIGWDSSYDNQPLPIEEMREYVECTTARILTLKPRRLLEIGCGTGLIMFPLLRHLVSYTGTDLSQSAIGRLAGLQAMEAIRARFPEVERAVLRQGRADELDWLAQGSVDTVILPSVVQYFPSADYLLGVLDRLINIVAPRACIFLGDVRSLPLLPLLHASIELAKAEDDLPISDLIERIRHRGEIEQELALAPEFFVTLGRRHRRLAAVEVLPKRGTRHNEMSRFRYDVVLRLDRTDPAIATVWRRWEEIDGGIDELVRRLSTERPTILALSGVPNARVAPERRLLRLLSRSARLSTAVDLRTALAASSSEGVEPEQLIEIADKAGYEVHFSMARSGRDGDFDIAFTAPGLRPLFPEPDCATAASAYANNPLQERLARALATPLRDHLRDRLPHYMVPADFVVLDSLPTTPAGKIDRRALMPPRPGVFGGDPDFVAPRTETEKALAAIWCEILGLERCGVRQNFFAAGGHSLKATQLVSRVATRLGIELPLRSVFSHPTLEELATQITPSAALIAPITRAPDAEHYPLSHSQRRLWILAQLEGGSVAYNMPASIRLDGRLDLAALEGALTACVARHEALRTSIAMVDGEPRQFVHRSASVPLPIVDFSNDPEPAGQAREAALRDAALPFDLENGPIVRFTLLRLAPDCHVLLANLHHIVCDDWSIGVIIRDVMQAYGGMPLPPLRVQYRDYAAWERQRLDSEAEQAHRAYWLERFREAPPALDLPADFPRPPVKTYNGRSLSFAVPTADLAGMRATAREGGATLFMALVAAVKVLLFRYTGQPDVTVAAPVAGRQHPDLEQQVGFYVNTLALRDRIDPDQSFRDLLAEVSCNTAAALEHQSYPFDRLVDELALRRDPGRMPLADVIVVMQDADSVELSLPGLAVGEFVSDYGASKYDVHFAFHERDGALQATLVYNTDLFATERIFRLRDHFQTLIAGIVADPDRPIRAMPILPPEERRQVLGEFNPTPGCQPALRTLTELFAERVRLHPDREAVSYRAEAFGGEREAMTYGELDEATERLARRLRAHGVGRGSLVGLFVERSLASLVGIIAILKAGAAYVPIEPAYPRQRIAFMIADAGLRTIVSQRQLAERLPPGAAALVLIEESGSEAPLAPDEISPDDDAYIIYTSGSTGQPKGVVVSHANATRLFAATHPWFGFDQSDVWTLFHSVAFDFSVWEIWGALLYGGRLVIVPFAATRWPDAFYSLVLEERVTVLNQTPTAFRELVAAEERSHSMEELALRLVIFGGEALNVQMLRPWFARHGEQKPQLVNMYGITEVTVHATYRRLGLTDLDRPTSRIGRPIPDLKLHILDAGGEPTPIGVPGEIYVGGAGVARGYLNRPELTAQRFIADPFSPHSFSHGRLYRSGDLGRYSTDGDIEYLGRIDQQVKIRGFRVELGEIEAVLATHSGVSQALALADDSGAEPRLVAYVVTVAGDAIIPELRGYLRAHLPDYMVPAAIVPIPGFPLTAHGKIDRAALPDGGRRAEGKPDAEECPRNPIEAALAEIAREVTGTDRMRLDDNFFDAGADSLLLVKLHRRLEERLRRSIALIALYQYPSMRALADYLGEEAPPPRNESLLAEAVARAERRRAARGAPRRRIATASDGDGHG